MMNLLNVLYNKEMMDFDALKNSSLILRRRNERVETAVYPLRSSSSKAQDSPSRWAFVSAEGTDDRCRVTRVAVALVAHRRSHR